MSVNAKVRAIKKWRHEFITIVELETGELLLAVEDEIKYQVKTGDEIVGEIVNGIFHIHDFAMVSY